MTSVTSRKDDAYFFFKIKFLFTNNIFLKRKASLTYRVCSMAFHKTFYVKSLKLLGFLVVLFSRTIEKVGGIIEVYVLSGHVSKSG